VPFFTICLSIYLSIYIYIYLSYIYIYIWKRRRAQEQLPASCTVQYVEGALLPGAAAEGLRPQQERSTQPPGDLLTNLGSLDGSPLDSYLGK